MKHLLFLSLLYLSLSSALGGDLSRTNFLSTPVELEDMRSQERISLTDFQYALERRLESSEPTKQNLLKTAGILKGFISHAESPFDKKTIAALEKTLERFATKFPKPYLELYLKELKEAQKNAIPADKGFDYQLFATGIILASTARGMAQRAKSPENADWFYLAGEAQYAATKTGTQDFENFLNLASPQDKKRIQKAKSRINIIKSLDGKR